jgi:hypothetical protein
MERKFLTTYCDLLCLDSEKFWGPFLLGGNALLKSLTALVLALFIFVAPALAAPGDVAYKQAQDLKNKGDLSGALTAANSGLAVDPANPQQVTESQIATFANEAIGDPQAFVLKAIDMSDINGELKR